MGRDGETRRCSEQLGIRWSVSTRGETRRPASEAKRDQRLGAELGRMTSKLNTLHENYYVRTGDVRVCENNENWFYQEIIEMTNIIMSD